MLSHRNIFNVCLVCLALIDEAQAKIINFQNCMTRGDVNSLFANAYLLSERYLASSCSLRIQVSRRLDSRNVLRPFPRIQPSCRQKARIPFPHQHPQQDLPCSKRPPRSFRLGGAMTVSVVQRQSRLFPGRSHTIQIIWVF